MIRILMVQGDVLVDDKERGYMQMAKMGLVLPDRGNYLIATNATSRASIDVGGKIVLLEPSCGLRVRPDGRSWWERHGLAPGGDSRLWLGRVWAKMGGTTKDDTLGGGGGIRG